MILIINLIAATWMLFALGAMGFARLRPSTRGWLPAAAWLSYAFASAVLALTALAEGETIYFILSAFIAVFAFAKADHYSNERPTT